MSLETLTLFLTITLKKKYFYFFIKNEKNVKINKKNGYNRKENTRKNNNQMSRAL